MNKQQKQRSGRSSGSASFQSKTEPIRQVAARWSNRFVTGDYSQLDEMTRLAPGTGSIGGGNSAVQDLMKAGSLSRGKIYAHPDGTAMVLFTSSGKPAGCAYLEISGQYVTDARIAKF
jgi:hypothetical protein